MLIEEELTLGEEHTMQKTDAVLQNFILEMYTILLANVTAIYLII